jgi:predicted metalloprotease with PDZ domain
VDTARAAYTLYGVAPEWRSWRRGVDFYEEGVLIWLEVDSTIRALSDGARSLDDFCAAFFAGAVGEPLLSPYRYEDLLGALQAVAPHDWARFFEERIYAVAPRAPLGGIESAGWRLVYSDKPNLAQADIDENDESIDLRFSLGIVIESESGRLLDVLPGSPAAAAELPPGAELVAVNGRRWSKSILRAALAEAAKSDEPIRLLVANSEFFHEASLRYRGGERHPHLERIAEREDRLSAILAPRTP